MNAMPYIPRYRFAKILKALCKAATLDAWDLQKGNTDMTTGDRCFKPDPNNFYEQNLWQSLRNQQKEDLRALSHIKEVNKQNADKGGRPPKENKPAQDSKPLTPLPAAPGTPNRKKAVDELLKRTAESFSSRGDGMRIYPDMDFAKLRGAFGDFLRRTFSPPTLQSMTSFLRKNYAGRDATIQTVLKTGCTIQKLNFDNVWVNYVRCVCD